MHHRCCKQYIECIQEKQGCQCILTATVTEDLSDYYLWLKANLKSSKHCSQMEANVLAATSPKGGHTQANVNYKEQTSICCILLHCVQSQTPGCTACSIESALSNYKLKRWGLKWTFHLHSKVRLFQIKIKKHFRNVPVGMGIDNMPTFLWLS